MTDLNAACPDEQTHAIIGAAMEVHRELGPGFLEQVYQDALTVELCDRDVPFERETVLRVSFKGRVLTAFYRPDFVCFGAVIVEVKAQTQLTPVDLAQMINYLKVSGASRGLVINFGAPRLEWKRVICSEHGRRPPATREVR